jgi:hypothetical protein
MVEAPEVGVDPLNDTSSGLQSLTLWITERTYSYLWSKLCERASGI